MPIRPWKLAKSVAVLPRSKLASCSTQFIVRHPVTPGPQSCLVLSKKPPPYAKTSEIVDALVVLPTSVPPSQGFPNPEYAGYLAIADHHYKEGIAVAKRDANLMTLAARRLSKTAPLIPSVSARVRRWEPDILAEGEVKKNSRWKEAWLIVSRWTDWEFGKKSWRQRFEEHCYNQGKMPPGNPRVLRKAIQRFRGKCRTINLPTLPW